jgi:AraC-like DNA-binding protein
MSDLYKRLPAGPLANYVSSLRIVARERPEWDTVAILPIGRTAVMIACEKVAFEVFEGSGSRARIVDSPALLLPTTKTQYVTVPRQYCKPIASIEFKPCGLRAFTATGLDRLRPGLSPAKQLFGNVVDEWGPHLEALAYQGADAIFDALEALLMRHLRAPPEYISHVQRAAEALGNAQRHVSIAATAAESGMTTRQFRRAFLDATGIKPKMFARLARFRAALNNLHHHTGQNVAAVAVDHGYFDHAHFLHEFKALGGGSLGTYRAQRREHSACLFTNLQAAWQEFAHAPSRLMRVAASEAEGLHADLVLEPRSQQSEPPGSSLAAKGSSPI